MCVDGFLCQRADDGYEIVGQGRSSAQRLHQFKGHQSINDCLLYSIAEIVLGRTVRLLEHQHRRQFFDWVGP